MGINSRELSNKLAEDIDAYFPKGCGDYPPLRQALIQEAFAASLKKSLTKKLVTEINPELDRKALELFLNENNRMRDFDVTPVTSIDEILLNETRNSFRNVFDCDDIWWTLRECCSRGRTGPGSSRMAKGQSFYEKLFASPLSMTSEILYKHYVEYVKSFPTWETANSLRSQKYGESLLSESRLSFVPKTDSIARTICTEPSLNMFFQLGLKELIDIKLRRIYGIDMSIQPDRNRRLTRVGSLDGSFSTIDLSSASDNFSLKLLRWLLKPNSTALNTIETLRTSHTLLPNGDRVELHMVSTMGNGFTFPLQTLLFSCAVAAVYRTFDIKLVNTASQQNFGVFGDDIVVRTEVYERLCHLLGLLGFKVNGDKSFSKGFFRESCGHDYFLGRDVRGVYIKDISSQQARYSAINRLNDWTSKSGIPLRRTIAYLIRTVRYIPVPRCEADVSGVRVPYWMSRPVKGKYSYFVAVPRSRQIECPVCARKGDPCPHINPEGALVSLLHGSLRNGRVTPRQRVIRYVLKTRNISLWSDIPSDPISFEIDRALPWETAVWLNLAEPK